MKVAMRISRVSKKSKELEEQTVSSESDISKEEDKTESPEMEAALDAYRNSSLEL